MRADIGFVRNFMVVIMLSSSYNCMASVDINQGNIDFDYSTTSSYEKNSSSSNNSIEKYKNSLNMKTIEYTNSKEVEYDSDTMWFDYQSLFDKIKHKYNNTEVKCTNFEENILAKHTLFDDDNYHDLLLRVLNGDIKSISKLIYNCASYAYKLFGAGYEILYNKNQCKYVALNYKYLVAIVASLGKDDNNITKQYLAYTNGYKPNFILFKNILPDSLYDVMQYTYIAKDN